MMFIFAADHREGLKSAIFKTKKELNKKQIQQMHEFKEMILESFIDASKDKIMNPYACLLMDEHYGEVQLKKAKKLGLNIIIPVEKSGVDTFEFEYKKNFKEHIKKFNPKYVKILIHFNPANTKDNKKSVRNIKILNEYIKKTKSKLLIELLIKPTKKELKRYGQKKFDMNIRPGLTIDSIHMFNSAGIYPEIWKLEGFEKEEDLAIVAFATGSAKIVILGRSESMDKVLKWIKIGAKNKKVCGFAVGRTIFLDALKKYYHKKISRDRAITIMAERYQIIADSYLKAKL